MDTSARVARPRRTKSARTAKEHLTRSPVIDRVEVDERYLTFWLADGRRVSAPLSEYPVLAAATPEQRTVWELQDGDTGVHWPAIDEDIHVSSVLGVSEDMVYDAAGFKRGWPAE